MIRRTAALSVVLALLLPLTACGGGSDAATKGKSTHDVLALAKQKFDQVSSVHLVLATQDTPTKGDAVLGADGTLTHQPAFEGKVTVVLGGFNADVPVISVGGKVYAKLPLTPKYVAIDPSEYGSPDPADFADPATGISGLLLKLDGAKKAGQTRVGDQVLTTYTGTLTGDLVQPIIPSADKSRSYTTTVGIDQDGRISTLRIAGGFFAHDGDVTYDLTFSDYGKNVKISAP
jgi:lipoprotein LprG